MKIKIVCPHCLEEHKLKYYSSGDSYECPRTMQVFEVDDELTAKPIADTNNTIFTNKSMMQSDYLLPLVKQFVKLNPDNHKKSPSQESTSIDHKASDKSSAKNLPQWEVEKIGKYKILDDIGSGGFGTVYKGYDEDLKRYVAIKVSRRVLKGEAIESFKQEAAVQAQLNHQNIVQIYDFGMTQDDLPYIVMEYVTGTNIVKYVENLKKNGANSEMILKKAMSIFVSVSEAFLYLEEKGICHQDIKPENIIISEELQTAKLVDFGLAAIDDTTVENRGYSPKYTAPERFNSEIRPSIVNDIFSFGFVMYRVLTGRAVVESKSFSNIISTICTQEMQFRQEDQVDEQLKRICQKCSKINIEERYQKSKDLNIDLVDYLSQISETNDYPYLYLVDGHSNVVFYLKKKRNYIGRSFSNDIILQQHTISRVHACVSLQNNQFFLENLSQQPIHLHYGDSSEKLENKQTKPLKHGAKVEISGKTLYFIGEISCHQQNVRSTQDSKLSENYYSEEDVLQLVHIDKTTLDQYTQQYNINTLKAKEKTFYSIPDIDRLKNILSNEQQTIVSDINTTNSKEVIYSFDTAYVPARKWRMDKEFHVYECENTAKDKVFIRTHHEIELPKSNIRIDHYDVVEMLGKGAMGEVFKGKDYHTNEWVALKILKAELCDNPRAKKRFQREMKETLHIQHPNLVKIYGTGEYRGRLYYAMEYIEGNTVKQHIQKNGYYQEQQGLEIVLQVCKALEAMQEKGDIIHRDIKPDNIMITNDGIAKLCDMGLAKSTTSDGIGITMQGAVLGTPHYMSPEQTIGEELDFRTDIFSLGATFYYMLTGIRPFEGASPIDTLEKISKADYPPLSQHNFRISDKTSWIVAKMMAKNRDERYQSYRELITVIEQHLKNLMSRTPLDRYIRDRKLDIAPGILSYSDVLIAQIALHNKVISSEKMDESLNYQQELHKKGIDLDMKNVLLLKELITLHQSALLDKAKLGFLLDRFCMLFFKACAENSISSPEIQELQQQASLKSENLIISARKKYEIVKKLEEKIDEETLAKIYCLIRNTIESEEINQFLKTAIKQQIITKEEAEVVVQVYKDKAQIGEYISALDILLDKNYIHYHDAETLLYEARRNFIMAIKDSV